MTSFTYERDLYNLLPAEVVQTIRDVLEELLSSQGSTMRASRCCLCTSSSGL